MFETILHVAGNRTYILEFENELFMMDPGFDCENQKLSDWNPYNSPTTSFIMKLIDRVNKPLTNIFVSHYHRDHSFNIPYFIDLRNHFPDKFPFRIICHENLIVDYENVLKIELDSKLEIDNNELWILTTPGHTKICDDISLWYPKEALVFVGDIVQPQGPAYEVCTFSTPVSNHRISSLVIESLKKLRGLPFKHLLMGHEGEILDSFAGVNSIDVTLEVLNREYELAQYVINEFPGESIDEYCDFVYETISKERGLPKEHINFRKSNGHEGECEFNSPLSFYQLYDIVSIREIVEKICRN